MLSFSHLSLAILVSRMVSVNSHATEEQQIWMVQRLHIHFNRKLLFWCANVLLL